jgi:GxxExxY protein
MLLERQTTERIIAAYYAVYRTLGFGFVESVYTNALVVSLQQKGLRVRREVPIEVLYEGVTVGNFRCDLLVEDSVIVEVKAARPSCDADEVQLLNYLRATRLEIGMLLYFGQRARFRRFVYSNSRKQVFPR